MILHIVTLSHPASADTAERGAIMAGLSDLVGRITGFRAFDHGPNIDAEGKSPEAPYGFVCSFDDRAALEWYTKDPAHRALGARLVNFCGGAEQIKVYDIETGAV